jgi:hypothetical protein
MAVCLGALLHPAVATACDHVGAYRVNLSQDAADLLDPNVCTSKIIHSQIRQCIAQQISNGIPPACQRNIDIFVPGTAAEHGAWKQFNHLFRSDTDRAHLVLQYDDARTVEGVANFDGALYDQGVKDARRSLILLLDALRENFAIDRIRVFGHSKGSHAVALVADEPPYGDIEFYAFAQPGRTSVDIDTAPEIVPGRRGTPGYIEKLSPNLVGITWQNDEVQYYVGDGLSGLNMPEIWSFPGYIWQENTGGGATPAFFRIDHHNNYGGVYTDGIAGNSWAAGEGTESDNYPYCATGDQFDAAASSECNKQNARVSPWFWGTPECVAEAERMMARGNPGDRYFIGYSGPRLPGSCRESQYLTKVGYSLRYRFNLPDKDCVYHLRFSFDDIRTGLQTDTFEVTGTTANDQTWLMTPAGRTVYVTYHTRVRIHAWLEEVSQGGLFPDCENFVNESEAYINYLKLSFLNPGTGAAENRTIIGLGEGRGSDLLFADLHRWDNVAWEQPQQASEELKMYYTLPLNSIKIEGLTFRNYEGKFQKRVHLLD